MRTSSFDRVYNTLQVHFAEHSVFVDIFVTVKQTKEFRKQTKRRGIKIHNHQSIDYSPFVLDQLRPSFTREVKHALHLLVVEEVVERPYVALLAKGI